MVSPIASVVFGPDASIAPTNAPATADRPFQRDALLKAILDGAICTFLDQQFKDAFEPLITGDRWSIFAIIR